MNMANPITLDGCSPIPIASYLKALGVLRLLSLRANSVTGQAADRNVRGWWENTKFHLLTGLDREGILNFFSSSICSEPCDCTMEWR